MKDIPVKTYTGVYRECFPVPDGRPLPSLSEATYPRGKRDAVSALRLFERAKVGTHLLPDDDPALSDGSVVVGAGCGYVGLTHGPYPRCTGNLSRLSGLHCS